MPRRKRKPEQDHNVPVIFFDSHNIPKGDESVIEKFLGVRTENGEDEVLVKYKVAGLNTAYGLSAL